MPCFAHDIDEVFTIHGHKQTQREQSLGRGEMTNNLCPVLLYHKRDEVKFYESTPQRNATLRDGGVQGGVGYSRHQQKNCTHNL